MGCFEFVQVESYDGQHNTFHEGELRSLGANTGFRRPEKLLPSCRRRPPDLAKKSKLLWSNWQRNKQHPKDKKKRTRTSSKGLIRKLVSYQTFILVGIHYLEPSTFGVFVSENQRATIAPLKFRLA